MMSKLTLNQRLEKYVRIRGKVARIRNFLAEAEELEAAELRDLDRDFPNWRNHDAKLPTPIDRIRCGKQLAILAVAFGNSAFIQWSQPQIDYVPAAAAFVAPRPARARRLAESR